MVILNHFEGKPALAAQHWQNAEAKYGTAQQEQSGLDGVLFRDRHSPSRLLAAISLQQGDALAAWERLENELAHGLRTELDLARHGLTEDESKRIYELRQKIQKEIEKGSQENRVARNISALQLKLHQLQVELRKQHFDATRPKPN